MGREIRTYTPEYKAEAVKLAREIGNSKAASELGIPPGTLGGWTHAAKYGGIDTGKGTQTPQSAMTQATEIKRLKEALKSAEKENALLKKTNEFLEEATRFFAQSRKK